MYLLCSKAQTKADAAKADAATKVDAAQTKADADKADAATKADAAQTKADAAIKADATKADAACIGNAVFICIIAMLYGYVYV